MAQVCVMTLSSGHISKFKVKVNMSQNSCLGYSFLNSTLDLSMTQGYFMTFTQGIIAKLQFKVRHGKQLCLFHTFLLVTLIWMILILQCTIYLLCLRLKKEGHIVLYKSCWRVSISVSLKLMQLITRERFTQEASNLVDRKF